MIRMPLTLMSFADDLQPITLAKARTMFGQFASQLRSTWQAQSVGDSLRKVSRDLQQPMRVAMAGQIKQGKSTLVNALIQRDIAATGLLETTFSVTELYHASKWEGFVYYRDGSGRRIDRQELNLVTVRDAGSIEQLRRIDRVCIGEDVQLLRRFRLIDTPGLGSVYRDDSANTLALLDQNNRRQYEKLISRGGKTGEELHRESASELGAADAVLFLFSAGLADYDSEVVTRFLGEPTGSVTP
jgi:predicted GTPase